jgi:hypothetical protein
MFRFHGFSLQSFLNCLLVPNADREVNVAKGMTSRILSRFPPSKEMQKYYTHADRR